MSARHLVPQELVGCVGDEVLHFGSRAHNPAGWHMAACTARTRHNSSVGMRSQRLNPKPYPFLKAMRVAFAVC